MNEVAQPPNIAIAICVVIPAYNAAKFICDALDSIAFQTRKPDEIIIVDDGSTDNTCELIAMWKENNDLAVRVISQENTGLPAARNAAIKNTLQGWIALLDADDIWCSDHLASLESAVINFSDSVLVFGDIYIFLENTVIAKWFSKEKAIAVGVQQSEGECYQLDVGLYKSLVPGNYIAPSSIMFSREAAASIHFFDESLRIIEDRDFLLRLSKVGGFIYTKKITVGCREHDANITNKKNALRNHYFAFRVLKKMLNNSAQLSLDSSEYALTRKELSVTAGNLIYSASIKSLEAYVEALRFLFKNKMHRVAFNPKHFARTMFHSVGGLH